MSEESNDLLARMKAHGGTAYVQALGAEVIALASGKTAMRLPYSEKLVGNPDTGVVHGGVITGLLDHACGMAVGSALGEVVLGEPRRGMAVGSALGEVVLGEPRRGMTSYATLDLRIDYMKAAKPGVDIIVVGECVKITRQIVFARGRAYQESEDEPIATAVGTFMMTELRPAEA